MATAVVSGRVDAHVKQEVDRIIARAGKTPGDVIKDLWLSIYQAGELPVTKDQEAAFKEKRRSVQEFISFIEAAPAVPDWAVTLTDDQMNRMMASDLLAGDEAHV